MQISGQNCEMQYAAFVSNVFLMTYSVCHILMHFDALFGLIHPCTPEFLDRFAKRIQFSSQSCEVRNAALGFSVVFLTFWVFLFGLIQRCAPELKAHFAKRMQLPRQNCESKCASLMFSTCFMTF